MCALRKFFESSVVSCRQEMTDERDDEVISVPAVFCGDEVPRVCGRRSGTEKIMKDALLSNPREERRFLIFFTQPTELRFFRDLESDFQKIDPLTLQGLLQGGDLLCSFRLILIIGT